MTRALHSSLFFLAVACAAIVPTRGAAQPATFSADAHVDVDDAAEAAAADDGNVPDGEETRVQAMHARALDSWQGATGGFHLVDGGSGLTGSVRLQLSLDYFRGSDYLNLGDTNETVNGTLALSVSVADHVEVFGTFQNRANSNSFGTPVLLQVVGDVLLGVKGHVEVLPWLGLGGDIRLGLLNGVGDLGFAAGGTSLGLRGAGTVDLRRIEKPIPLILRGNLDYLFDNSAQLIEDVEEARYRILPPSTRRSRANEDRQLISRIERLAFGVNRVDMLTFGLGAEVPLRAAEDFYVHPLAELSLGLPVNRQGYNCLSVVTDGSIGQDDGCLGVQGLAAAPATLTLGARVLPNIHGLSASLGIDIGLGGTATFVRELAPNRPWMLLFSIGYGDDARPSSGPQRIVRVNVPTPAVNAVPARARVVGIVVDQGNGNAIAGAAVRYVGRDLSAQLSGDDGRFTSYELDPGEVKIGVSHPDYEPAECALFVPKPASTEDAPPSAAGPDTVAVSGLAPVELTSPDGTAVIPGAVDPNHPLEVPMRCELVARPRAGTIHGHVTGEAGASLGNVSIELTGPAPRTLMTDPNGMFALDALPAGLYTLHLQHPDYMPGQQDANVQAALDTTLEIALSAKPKVTQVVITAREVKIRKQIMFKPNLAEIDEQSTSLLQEIATVLIANPQAAHVQVQGHTDNKGDSSSNLHLSQERAEAVVHWLVNAGVAAERLEAKGYGDTHPLVPNLTPGNRARNRRVQFMISN